MITPIITLQRHTLSGAALNSRLCSLETGIENVNSKKSQRTIVECLSCLFPFDANCILKATYVTKIVAEPR